MNKLFAFFKRFQIFLLFAGLQFLALSNYFSSLSFPRSQYLTTANNFAGALWSVQYDFLKFVQLEETNNDLVQANKRLMERLPESFVRLSSKTFQINDTLFEQQYSYTPATVINSTHKRQNNFLTINIGSKLGIERGMGVFNESGVVGIVHAVSKHFSIIKSVLSEDINIDVMIEQQSELENDDAHGILKWKTNDPSLANINGISNDLDLEKEAPVVTRGGGGIFPRGLAVGKIHDFQNIEGEALWDVEVDLSVEFRTIQKVYVIKNLLKKEQQDLEALIPEEDE